MAGSRIAVSAAPSVSSMGRSSSSVSGGLRSGGSFSNSIKSSPRITSGGEGARIPLTSHDISINRGIFSTYKLGMPGANPARPKVGFINSDAVKFPSGLGRSSEGGRSGLTPKVNSSKGQEKDHSLIVRTDRGVSQPDVMTITRNFKGREVVRGGTRFKVRGEDEMNLAANRVVGRLAAEVIRDVPRIESKVKVDVSQLKGRERVSDLTKSGFNPAEFRRMVASDIQAIVSERRVPSGQVRFESQFVADTVQKAAVRLNIVQDRVEVANRLTKSSIDLERLKLAKTVHGVEQVPSGLNQGVAGIEASLRGGRFSVQEKPGSTVNPQQRKILEPYRPLYEKGVLKDKQVEELVQTVKEKDAGIVQLTQGQREVVLGEAVRTKVTQMLSIEVVKQLNDLNNFTSGRAVLQPEQQFEQMKGAIELVTTVQTIDAMQSAKMEPKQIEQIVKQVLVDKNLANEQTSEGLSQALLLVVAQVRNRQQGEIQQSKIVFQKDEEVQARRFDSVEQTISGILPADGSMISGEEVARLMPYSEELISKITKESDGSWDAVINETRELGEVDAETFDERISAILEKNIPVEVSEEVTTRKATDSEVQRVLSKDLLFLVKMILGERNLVNSNSSALD